MILADEDLKELVIQFIFYPRRTVWVAQINVWDRWNKIDVKLKWEGFSKIKKKLQFILETPLLTYSKIQKPRKKTVWSVAYCHKSVNQLCGLSFYRLCANQVFIPKKPDSQSYQLAAQLKIKPCDVAFLPPLTELALAFFAALPELLQDLQSRAYAAAPASSSSSLSLSVFLFSFITVYGLPASLCWFGRLILHAALLQPRRLCLFVCLDLFRSTKKERVLSSNSFRFNQLMYNVF